MYSSKMMIVMRRDLKMRKGKIAAQAGHAALNAALTALAKEKRLEDIEYSPEGLIFRTAGKPETALSEWFTKGEAKICVYVDSEEELLRLDREAKEKGIISALIMDAGMTEFHGEPTYTCLAFEPQPADIIDPLTGNLPLY